ncbi:MAG: PhzF family phenazine biosynthesis isomerase, partial [Bacteroidota bacterium]
ITDRKVRAFIFTCEEELNFAGHPVLGAAAVLHDLLQTSQQQEEWIFVLNEKEVSVTTQKKENHYEALMNQGKVEFGKILNAEETQIILDCMNLNADDLFPGCSPMVASTGLPYLLIPLQKNGLAAKITVPDLEKKMAPFKAKFIGTIEIPSLNIRTWDNAGTVEDAATGSLAGPVGAYLVQYGFKEADKIIQLHQGKNIGRPSQLFVTIKMQAGSITDVFVGGGVCKISQSMLANELVGSL